MQVVIRTDASAEIGLGHLMRCLALAQALVAELVEVIFVLKSHSVPFCQSRHDWAGQVKVLPQDISQQNEISWMQQQCWFAQSQFVVLDGYQFDQHYRQQLAKASEKLVLFDDANLAGNLHADLIINGAQPLQADYYAKCAPNALLCVGERHRILRQEFYHQPCIAWPQRHSLTLIMGGSDPKNITLPLLHALDEQQANMPIRVIVGAGYADLPQLQAFIQRSGLSIQLLVDCQQIADIFSYSRLVVSAAGGSQYELLACATPAILLVVAANQQQATKRASEQGWCQSADISQQANFALLAQHIINLWQNETALHKMHQHAQRLADTQGASRVLEKISEMLRD
ncbi:UDP-2,4-diacetamido-2,4,6-trideoxy-beta-L-altropyranose hydrolase [uncultured Paraglaciecola sp.]|uniref:UDP-2,4-diacetamido-2,4, 6-trideoxy-beta-L-altropyranose hydrolase n=1 Tax=uncultured Paraglaciecola sp. TaxID=1765024 RepID=UPI002622D73A|nr:UDP-2,4-diacetamido-2,4,6-trideoxy-beta-L-altropyranose hydrolase [uncultured Paraglaciecola sp.]